MYKSFSKLWKYNFENDLYKIQRDIEIYIEIYRERDRETERERVTWCNLRISVKTRQDMDIIEIATANTRSDMNAAVNMETSWGKSLEMLPQFTIQEIEQYRQLSGKTPELAIIKTLYRGRKFKNECYITSDSIFTKCDKGVFYVKGLCKASMKKETFSCC